MVLKKGCNKKAVKKDWLERIVVKLTVDKVLQDREIDRIADALIILQDKEDLTIPALKQQLAATVLRLVVKPRLFKSSIMVLIVSPSA